LEGIAFYVIILCHHLYITFYAYKFKKDQKEIISVAHVL
jgi:hypothetical protein